jgi:septal ring factor EnvC (AmiA/AmiB activator)
LNQIAIYVVENKAVIPVLWGLLALVIILVAVSIMYVLLRLKLRTHMRLEAQLARNIATKSDEIARFEEKLAQYIEMEDGVDDLKGEVRRLDAIRGKTEDRLVAQNAELEKARTDLAVKTAEAATQAAELAKLRRLVEHIDDL